MVEVCFSSTASYKRLGTNKVCSYKTRIWVIGVKTHVLMYMLGIGAAALQALSVGGSQALAYSSALASALSRGGCGAVGNVLAQSEAIASSSGKGDAFAKDVAKASVEAAKCPKLRSCSTITTAKNCCTR
jgi:hypothetical protein